MKLTNGFPSLALLILISSLTACGGGGGGGSPAADTPNTSGSGGSNSSPQILTYPSSFDFNGLMRANQGVAYYKVVGLIAGEDYKVTLTSDVGLGFNGYRNADYQSGFECGPSSNATCTANSTGDLYLMAWSTTGPVSDSNYTLSIVSTINEGSPTAAKDLTNLLPYSATFTSPKVKSFYTVSGLTAGNSYSVNLEDGSDTSFDLYVYQDGFVSEACSAISSVSAKSCSLTVASNQIWFTVKGTGNFTLSITDNGAPVSTYSNEGTSGSPVTISYSADGKQYSGQVGSANSYYYVSGLKVNTAYTFVLNNTFDNADIFTYSNNTFVSSTCPTNKVTEYCIETSNASGELWFSVSGENATQLLGTSFDIYVNEYFPDEGTSSNRLVLNYSEPLTYNGTADNYSYYQLTGMQANTTYLIDVTNYIGSVEVYAVSVDPTEFSSCNGREETIGSGVLRCLVTSGNTGIIDLRVREGSHITTTSFDITISVSQHQSEGSKQTPVALTSGLNQVGSIGGVSSYYRIDGLTADTAYTVTVSGLNSAHDFYIYQDGTGPNLWNKNDYDCTGDMSRTSCTRRTLDTSMWLMVGEMYPLNGSALTINVVESAYQSEGSLATPIPLSFDSVNLPYSGATDSSQSYYEITGLTPGTEYALSLSNVSTNDSANFYVYDDNALFGSTVYGESVCDIFVSNGSTRFCRITPTNSSLWVMLDGSDTGQGAFYDLNASLSPAAEILTVDSSVTGTFPRASSTNEVQSQYTINNLLPNQLYNVSISGLTADIDLTVGKNSFSSTACDSQAGNTDELCVISSNSVGEVRVSVKGSKSIFGAFFTLNLTQGPSNEGSLATPINVIHDTAIGTSVRSSQVGSQSSYYKITGLTSGSTYEVNLKSLSGNVRMWITDDATYDTFTSQCSSNNTTTTDEHCGGIADPTGALYVLVNGPSSGANFSLEVLNGLTPDGSITTGQSIVYSGVLTSYNGQVDLISSYYTVTNLDPKASYTMTVTGMTDNVNLYVYTDLSFSVLGCSSQQSQNLDDSCAVTIGNGGATGSAVLYVKITGDSTVAGATYTLQVAP